MGRKSLTQLNNPANLVCGGLLLLLFVFMCVSSYKTYKQKKEIPRRIEKNEEDIKGLKKKVKELSRKIKEKWEEPIPYEEVKLPHPSRELAKVPIVREFDNCSYMTACVIWENGKAISGNYWDGNRIRGF